MFFLPVKLTQEVTEPWPDLSSCLIKDFGLTAAEAVNFEGSAQKSAFSVRLTDRLTMNRFENISRCLTLVENNLEPERGSKLLALYEPVQVKKLGHRLGKGVKFKVVKPMKA